MKTILAVLVIAAMTMTAWAQGVPEAPDLYYDGIEELHYAEDAADPWEDDWYGALVVRSGTVFDRGKTVPFGSGPVLGWRDFSLEFGVSKALGKDADDPFSFMAITYDVASLGDVGVDMPFADFVNLHVGFYLTNDWVFGNEPRGGLLLTILDVDMQQGNTEKQATAKRLRAKHTAARRAARKR